MKLKLDQRTKCQVVQAEFKACIDKLYRYNARMKFQINNRTFLIKQSGPTGPNCRWVHVVVGRWPLRRTVVYIGTDISARNPELTAYQEKYLPLLPAIISRADAIETTAHYEQQSRERSKAILKETFTNHLQQIN